MQTTGSQSVQSQVAGFVLVAATLIFMTWSTGFAS